MKIAQRIFQYLSDVRRMAEDYWDYEDELYGLGGFLHSLESFLTHDYDLIKHLDKDGYVKNYIEWNNILNTFKDRFNPKVDATINSNNPEDLFFLLIKEITEQGVVTFDLERMLSDLYLAASEIEEAEEDYEDDDDY